MSVNEANHIGDAVADRKTGQGLTPGPWMYRRNPGRGKEDWTFHIDRQGTPGRMNWGILIAACWGHVSESAEANARLIAAAPALYEALKESALRTHTIGAYHSPASVPFEKCDKTPCVKARAALDLVSRPADESAQRLISDRRNDSQASKSKSESV